MGLKIFFKFYFLNQNDFLKNISPADIDLCRERWTWCLQPMYQRTWDLDTLLRLVTDTFARPRRREQFVVKLKPATRHNRRVLLKTASETRCSAAACRGRVAGARQRSCRCWAGGRPVLGGTTSLDRTAAPPDRSRSGPSPPRTPEHRKAREALGSTHELRWRRCPNREPSRDLPHLNTTFSKALVQEQDTYDGRRTRLPSWALPEIEDTIRSPTEARRRRTDCARLRTRVIVVRWKPNWTTTSEAKIYEEYCNPQFDTMLLTFASMDVMMRSTP